jgi:hypothetical protein
LRAVRVPLKHVAHRPQTIALADRVIHLGPPAEPLPSRQALAS